MLILLNKGGKLHSHQGDKNHVLQVCLFLQVPAWIQSLYDKLQDKNAPLQETHF